MINELKGSKPTLTQRLYQKSKEDSVWCTLEKYDNPDNALEQWQDRMKVERL